MRRIITIWLALFFMLQLTVADEGMWLLPLIQKLNIKRMNELGFKLTADDIYNVNHACLKDAVVALDFGACTAEMISPDGLLLTNHHCGYENIQEHSTVEHDYLTNGFWSMNRKEELPNLNKTVTFLIKMEDVTEKINSELDTNLSEEERDIKIKEISNRLEKEVADSSKFYDAKVATFFSGSQFFLIVTQTFRDVRLVGAPPSSIGKFGGDTDNWMWPRHTGDFTIFRVYCNPDGKPSEYSEKNIPYHPKYYLQVSLKGVQQGDFTMIMGYPGITNRYITSSGIKEIMNVTDPNRIKIRGIKQDLWMKDMLEDNKIRIQYSNKYYESSNYWKYSIGRMKFINRLGLMEKREQQEKEFINWVSQDQSRKSQYGNVLSMLNESYLTKQNYEHTGQYLEEAFFESLDIMHMGYGLFSNASLGKSGDLKFNTENVKKYADIYFKDFNPETDKKVAVAMLELYSKNVPKEFQPDIYILIQSKYNGNYKKYIDNIYSKSVLAKRNKLDSYLAKPSLRLTRKDPGIQMFMILQSLYAEILNLKNKFESNINKGSRLYLQGLRELNKDKDFYPDANSTMRITYGVVGGYKPMDGVTYNYFTTLTGVMEKEDPGNPEFVVSDKLKEIYKKKDFGRYSKDGNLSTCFITNNDIAGGNSGSPVLNANGELVGIAFDSNWEGMAGEIAYSNQYQKCICVDIRYVLFVIDKIAGAGNLLDEMKINE